ncbi:hypothetical protein ABKPCSM17A_02307 [Acinetobacter baumannii]|uniref:hypothetical protein n=1 Tax=Acinetobacter baumannii TaxID=470 RepID=UPI00135F79F1|nr:hypothetical protein [Acinetobacter baumannii]MDC5352845.1 hypothetical protein [Acinetobacter baumannii]CAA0235133.1 hypothetical protein ABKPCSM17A_02307 [Acinetobacter baumannii]
MKKILLSSILLAQSSLLFAAGNPVAVGDVLGRDLSVTGFGALGHLGMLASSNNVVQVMNATSYVNIVQNVTVAGFKVDTYWGAKARSRFTWTAPYTSATNQINNLSNQQKPHVAYDLWSSTPNPATQVCSAYSSSGTCTAYTWKKGSFRCDAFVKWIYTRTGNSDLGGSLPNTTFDSSLLTITRT